jgi:Ni,Fe-hydrogenase III small subunit/Pyruvate/2-oxoacid:ferredoxin oxidoreductase delta subunit
MYRIIINRLLQGKLTFPYPAKEPAVADRFRGRPLVDSRKCQAGCHNCVEVCPVEAISQSVENGQTTRVNIDLGRCLFCTLCQEACPTKAIEYTREFRMATRKRTDLVVGDAGLKLAEALDAKLRRLFGRSLKMRVVSAGDCNGCGVEVNVLTTLVFDIARFGIQYVAAPRHADGLIITGPVTENMREALLKTYAAVPAPKIVIAVGACAISGGPFRDHPEVHNGADSVLPVDLYIPGCQPHPMTILDGYLRLLGRLPEDRLPKKYSDSFSLNQHIF